MATQIRVAVEGPGADTALGDLLSITSIQGHAEPAAVRQTTRDGGATLVAIATIVGVVSGVVTIVDAIIAWREKWVKAAASERLSVVLEDARGNRLLLDDATPEQIAVALRPLASPDSSAR